MATTHRSKHKSGGRWTESTTTKFKDGSSKTVRKDITDRNLLGGDKWKSTTRTNKYGNSTTKYR